MIAITQLRSKHRDVFGSRGVATLSLPDQVFGHSGHVGSDHGLGIKSLLKINAFLPECVASRYRQLDLVLADQPL